MKKLVKKLAIILPFIIGFVLASHWNAGRSFVVKYTPFIKKSVLTSAKDGASNLLENGTDMAKKLKEKLN